jgi:hypothetical protein
MCIYDCRSVPLLAQGNELNGLKGKSLDIFILILPKAYSIYFIWHLCKNLVELG